MKRRLGSALVLSGLFIFVSAVFADIEAEKIVEKAIQAQGGKAKLAKFPAMHIKLEGALYSQGYPNGLICTFESFWQAPNRYKRSQSYNYMGGKVNHTYGNDGVLLWEQWNARVYEPSGNYLEFVMEQQYAENLARLDVLKEKGSVLSVVDEVKVGEKRAVGVLVKSKGHRDVKLYFDKASGLLVNLEHRPGDDGDGDGYLEEIIYSDYQEKDGVKHYTRVIVLHDSNKVSDARVTEIEFFKKLDEKVFAKP